MILVTGATGHIGNVLVRRLAREGKPVRVLMLPGDPGHALAGLPIERVEGDICDQQAVREAIRGCDFVYHLAGKISILPGDQPDVWRVNVGGTENVLHGVQSEPGTRLVYTSSIHAIKRVPHGICIDEQMPFDPDNPYGAYDRSKAVASQMVLAAAHAGMDAVLICPTGVIGPFDYLGSEMGSFFGGVLKKRTSYYIDGAYDFVDVRDVVSGLVSAAQQGKPGETYILSGERWHILDLIHAVKRMAGIEGGSLIRIPLPLVQLVSLFSPIYYRLAKVRPILTRYAIEVLQSNAWFSSNKAKNELGYHARPMAETLADTVKWYLHRFIQEDSPDLVA